MVTTRTNTAVMATCVLLLYANLLLECQAWTTSNHSVRIPRSSSTNSLTTTTSTPAVAAPAAPHITTNNNNNITDEEMSLQQRHKLLQSALNYARKTDLKYGLCTPESTSAWSVVDELYLSMPEYSSAVEDNVRKVFGAK